MFRRDIEKILSSYAQYTAPYKSDTVNLEKKWFRMKE